MNPDIVRAWKDEDYRQNLSEEQLSTLPANPAGEMELTDSDLESISAGLRPLISLLNNISINSLYILTTVVNTCVIGQ